MARQTGRTLVTIERLNALTNANIKAVDGAREIRKELTKIRAGWEKIAESLDRIEEIINK